jgi:hypothetical protein
LRASLSDEPVANLRMPRDAADAAAQGNDKRFNSWRKRNRTTCAWRSAADDSTSAATNDDGITVTGGNAASGSNGTDAETGAATSSAAGGGGGDDSDVDAAAAERATARQATFAGALSMPDRTRVRAGDVHVKTWSVTNSGTRQWPRGVRLIFLRGDRDLVNQEEFAVRRAAAGATVEVSAVIAVPPTSASRAAAEKAAAAASSPSSSSSSGVFDGSVRRVAYFRLAGGDRRCFGPRMWCDVLVEADETSAANDAASETETLPLSAFIADTTPSTTSTVCTAPQLKHDASAKNTINASVTQRVTSSTSTTPAAAYAGPALAVPLIYGLSSQAPRSRPPAPYAFNGAGTRRPSTPVPTATPVPIAVRVSAAAAAAATAPVVVATPVVTPPVVAVATPVSPPRLSVAQPSVDVESSEAKFAAQLASLAAMGFTNERLVGGANGFSFHVNVCSLRAASLFDVPQGSLTSITHPLIPLAFLQHLFLLEKHGGDVVRVLEALCDRADDE